MLPMTQAIREALSETWGTAYDDLATAVTQHGIDWMLYIVWDDFSVSAPCQEIGQYLAELFPEYANTFTGDFL